MIHQLLLQEMDAEDKDDDVADQKIFDEYWSGDRRRNRKDPTPDEAVEHLKDLILSGPWEDMRPDLDA